MSKTRWTKHASRMSEIDPLKAQARRNKGILAPPVLIRVEAPAINRFGQTYTTSSTITANLQVTLDNLRSVGYTTQVQQLEGTNVTIVECKERQTGRCDQDTTRFQQPATPAHRW